MNIKAAVLWEQGKPLVIEDAELAPPGSGEVLVEVKAAGVCHSDLHAIRGDWPMKVPLVPGHEGAGFVREIGEGVTRVRAGDRVVLCWAPACGTCPPCKDGTPLLCDRLEKTTYRNRLPWGGSRLSVRGTEVAPFNELAAVGCAVVTGVGAVTNAARLRPDGTVAVIGAGGVGVNVIQGAVLARAAKIIAIDREAGPLEVARQLGATDLVQPTGKTSDAVKELTGGRGADAVFDTVGTPATLTDAILSTRKGGTIVITGLSRLDAQGAIRMYPFVMQEKRLIGSVYGSGHPLDDIARLVDLGQTGRIKLGELATRTYSLEQINDALGALGKGEGGRGVIFF